MPHHEEKPLDLMEDISELLLSAVFTREVGIFSSPRFAEVLSASLRDVTRNKATSEAFQSIFSSIKKAIKKPNPSRENRLLEEDQNQPQSTYLLFNLRFLRNIV